MQRDSQSSRFFLLQMTSPTTADFAAEMHALQRDDADKATIKQQGL